MPNTNSVPKISLLYFASLASLALHGLHASVELPVEIDRRRCDHIPATGNQRDMPELLLAGEAEVGISSASLPMRHIGQAAMSTSMIIGFVLGIITGIAVLFGGFYFLFRDLNRATMWQQYSPDYIVSVDGIFRSDIPSRYVQEFLPEASSVPTIIRIQYAFFGPQERTEAPRSITAAFDHPVEAVAVVDIESGYRLTQDEEHHRVTLELDPGAEPRNVRLLVKTARSLERPPDLVFSPEAAFHYDGANRSGFTTGAFRVE